MEKKTFATQAAFCWDPGELLYMAGRRQMSRTSHIRRLLTRHHTALLIITLKKYIQKQLRLS